jgi:hypothetical protein
MKLIFVYNANSGLGNHVMDALHKTFSPSTYECDLCSLSYGNVGPRKEWKQFLKNVNMESEFHFKDKFTMANPNLKDNFPVVYLKDENYQLLLSAKEMTQCKDVVQLIDLINEKIKTTI